MGITFAQNLVCSSGHFLGFGLLMRKNFIQQITQGTVLRKLFSGLILRWTSRKFGHGPSCMKTNVSASGVLEQPCAVLAFIPLLHSQHMAERWSSCCSLKYRNICLAGLLFSKKFGWKQELFVHLQIGHNPCVLCIVCSFFREQQGQTHCLWAAGWTELLVSGLAGPSSLCSSKVLAFTHWKEAHAITPGDSHHLENPVYMHWEHLHKRSLVQSVTQVKLLWRWIIVKQHVANIFKVRLLASWPWHLVDVPCIQPFI